VLTPRGVEPLASPAAVARARRALEATLGEAKVLSDPDALSRYGEDYSYSGCFPPDLVVRAETAADVQAVFAVATAERVPVTPRGLGSGKSGGALPIHGGIVLSLERMKRMVEIDRANQTATAQAGIVTADYMAAVEAEDLFYPPDPNSLQLCSLGGNVACNAGGPRALKYGVTRDYVLALEVVLPTGELITIGRRTRKGVTGYDLVGMMVGSEGTLGVITEITTRLIAKPRAVETALVAFGDVEQATRALVAVFAAGVTPRTLELLDHHALAAVRGKTPGRFPEDAGALWILETDAPTSEQAMAELERAATVCLEHGALDVRVAADEAQRQRIWEPRRVLSMTLAESAPKKLSEDIVVPRSAVPDMLRRVEAISARTGIRVATYGHAGDGNLHVNVLFDEASAAQAEQAVIAVMEAAVGLGGTISGEHGVGLSKRAFLTLEQAAPVIELQQRLKRAFDPHGILNPGKIFPSRGVHE
jgi:glycolate oxidase